MTDERSLLEGLRRIAVERMAEAIRTFRCAGELTRPATSWWPSAGPAASTRVAVAGRLGIGQVLVPADAGLLSAVGLGHAVVERFAQREVLRPFDDVDGLLEGWLDELEGEAVEALVVEGIDAGSVDAARRIVELRYLGQDAALEIQPEDGADLRQAFEEAYFKLFSYRPRERGIEVVSLRVVVRNRRREGAQARARRDHVTSGEGAQAAHRRFLDGEWREVPRFEISELETGRPGGWPGADPTRVQCAGRPVSLERPHRGERRCARRCARRFLQTCPAAPLRATAGGRTRAHEPPF